MNKGVFILSVDGNLEAAKELAIKHGCHIANATKLSLSEECIMTVSAEEGELVNWFEKEKTLLCYVKVDK